MSYLSHLECGLCGRRADADERQTVCPADGRPLLARYDLEAARDALAREDLEQGRPDLWRFAPLLPVRDPRHIVTLGEGDTPLLRARRLGEALGLSNLFVKEEGLNPTGTFKARGMAVALSAGIERGATRFAVPTAGNAGAALAAYAARAGVEARVFAPARSAPAVFEQARAYGAGVEKVDGLITDAASRVRALVEREPGWSDVSTLKEPYRLEGKKTMGYELALNFGWEVPDVVVYPTGGGTGLVGMWKAFDELEQLGWIGGERPRLVSVQSEGCAPIVRAFEAGAEFAEPWEDADTVANGLCVPKAVGDFLILRAVRETKGTAVAVSDQMILDARTEFARTEGISACTEGAATLAGARRLVDEGWMDLDERVVLFNTGASWTG